MDPVDTVEFFAVFEKLDIRVHSHLPIELVRDRKRDGMLARESYALGRGGNTERFSRHRGLTFSRFYRLFLTLASHIVLHVLEHLDTAIAMCTVSHIYHYALQCICLLQPITALAIHHSSCTDGDSIVPGHDRASRLIAGIVQAAPCSMLVDMGGNLFKLGRLPRARYLDIESDIRAYLDRTFGNAFYRIPRYYGDKVDFGDLDVILSGDIPMTVEAVRARITSDLGITRHKLTGAVWSTVYRDFQVDYFEKPAAIFESTYNFFCFNDLGNLLGKLFRRFNLKYGEDGLFWVFRRQGGPANAGASGYRKDILLSRDYRRIFSFLGLDPAPWEHGFADLPSMFRWVVSSPCFTVEPFLRRATTTEKRAKERPTFRAFIRFLEDHGIEKAHAFEADRDRYIPHVAQHFPEAGLRDAIAAERAAEERDAVIRSKFDGNIVMQEVPGLSGKKLGEFIRQFRAQSPDIDDRIYQASPADVRAMIRAFAARATHDHES